MDEDDVIIKPSDVTVATSDVTIPVCEVAIPLVLIGRGEPATHPSEYRRLISVQVKFFHSYADSFGSDIHRRRRKSQHLQFRVEGTYGLDMRAYGQRLGAVVVSA